MCSKMGSKIVPTWIPNGSKIAPVVFGVPGAPGGPKTDLERFMGPIGPSSFKDVSQFRLKAKVVFHASLWRPPGSLLGTMLESQAGKQDVSNTIKHN